MRKDQKELTGYPSIDKSAMKEYYKKPELSEATIVDGWIHTNDIAEIDENGFLYIWGRKNDCFESEDGTRLYPFDIAGFVMENKAIRDAIILPVNTGIPNFLSVHLAFNDRYSQDDKNKIICDILNMLIERLPKDFTVIGCRDYGKMLPFSPTTFKKDRDFMGKQTNGYVGLKDGVLVEVELYPDDNGIYEVR